MKRKSLYCFPKILIGVILAHGIITAQTVKVPGPDSPENRPASAQIGLVQIEEDLIHFGDLIEIDVIGSAEHDWRGSLTPEGFLDGVDFLEHPIYGLCRSVDDIGREIARSYGSFLRDPKVSVRILDRSDRPTTTLVGAVKNPQRFRIGRIVRLNELIIISGGLTESASGEIRIFRPKMLNCFEDLGEEANEKPGESPRREIYITTSETNASQFIDIKLSELLQGIESANPRIISGDVVTVLEALPVYVTGGVENPKKIALRSSMTLTRAIASAGGVSNDADQSKITIFRRGEDETSLIKADLDQINKNLAKDILLEAFDIVEVSRKGQYETSRPPILDILESNPRDGSKLPLRIID